MNAIEKAKDRAHWIVEEVSSGNWQSLENRLAEVIVEYETRLLDLSLSTPRNHDIAALIQEMRRGFEAMDKRFDDLIHQMDKRFESMDKRFEAMDKRFDDLIHQMDKRFDQVDKRFDDLIHQMDKRFEQVDKRFSMMFWIMAMGFTFFTFIITYGTFFKD